jgi:hypothetical protein
MAVLVTIRALLPGVIVKDWVAATVPTAVYDAIAQGDWTAVAARRSEGVGAEHFDP